MEIKPSSKIEVGLLVTIISGLVWVLTHILPTEARVNEHEKKLVTLEQKVDVIMSDTQYIRGKMEGVK